MRVPRLMGWFFFFQERILILLFAYLLLKYNVFTMLVSAVQHHESAICIYIPSTLDLPLTLPQFHPSPSPQSSELSFPCYTGFYLSSHSLFVLPSPLPLQSSSSSISLILSTALPEPSIPSVLEILHLHSPQHIRAIYLLPHRPSCQVHTLWGLRLFSWEAKMNANFLLYLCYSSVINKIPTFTTRWPNPGNA